MPVETLDPSDFLDAVVNKIPGWLHEYTALLSIKMLEGQERAGTGGPLLEIGVFRGRYLSIMLASAIRSNARIIGIDTFQFVEQGVVETGLRQHFGDEIRRVQFCRANSSDFDSDGLLSLVGERPRFISIDGSHEKHDVYLDLCICDAVLANDGVIAVDDFLNPLAIGVNEAAHAYFAVPRRVVPFAYLPNKLFLCRPSFAQTYFDMMHALVMDDKTNPISERYRNSPSHRMLFGQKMVVAS